ncbi:carboxypeptidase regulatory-like domain-containing protein [Pedobacter sp. N36a]|uniref:TonB-dependent receptor n=1 Tax=Pedobacter sp. N36a TaxID=2767996 RepID=UPI001657127E|nr:TonB-dependent receptor [Pedobacter sp. N36a]MBC8985970.1 carboxypeptidase regulatory-like domain-containing protein [Pedobacter sp. N36a]
MKSLRIILLSIFMFGYQLASAQATGGISGKVSLFDGQPYASASVTLLETIKTTLTDEQGRYSFQTLNPGNYTVRIQILGTAQKDISVQVLAGQTAMADYQLTKENVLALQEVTIPGNVNKFSRKESVYVARLPLKNLENPQVYSSIPKELFQEQMATDLGSIAKNVPGAGIPMIANQGRVTFRSRGFDTEPNARNGVAGAAFASIDPANIERVEVIKGPSTTLFGTSIASSYGGLYNRVTKKPYNGFGGELSYFAGSWDFNRIAVDVNTPVNADKTALFRLNAATSFEKTFQDQGFTNSLSIAPSFSYQITDKLSLLLDVEFGQAKGTSVVRFNPYISPTVASEKSIKELGFPYNKTFIGNDLPYQTQMMNIFAQANYKMSADWTSQTIISRARSSINGYITALRGTAETKISPQIITGSTAFIATNIQQNFIGDFKIANLRNRLVVGLDYYNNSNDFDRVTVNFPAVDFTNTPVSYRVSRFKVDSLTSKGALRRESNGDNTYSAYFSDVINITERLLAMVSLRMNHFENKGVYNITTGETSGGLTAAGKQNGPYKQTSLSQKFGMVYEVSKDHVSLFGNYMGGFFNKSGVTASGAAVKPEQANQLEFGVKGDVFDHKLVGTISYYDIKVKDVLRNDPDNLDNYQIQDGTQLSRGVEVELTANPFAGFNMVAGYAYNDSKLTKSSPSTNGLRPGLSGPPHSFNFWMSYRVPQGELKGLGIGFGGNAGSSAYHTNTTTTKIIIPAYTMLDASIFYDQPKYRVGFKVDNLTSEKAWSVRLTPQAPARFIGNVTLKF